MHEMIKGVFTSAVFSHLITNRSLLRQYCLIEARAAMLLGKPCLVWREDDERQAGYISFDNAYEQCPKDLRRYLFADQACSHAHTHAHTHARECACARMHACTHTFICTDVCTNAGVADRVKARWHR